MMMHLGVEQFEKPGIAFEIDIPEGEGGAHHKMAAGKGRMKTIHSAPLPLLRLLMSHLSLGNNESERFSNPRHFVPELLCNHFVMARRLDPFRFRVRQRCLPTSTCGRERPQ